METWKKYMFSQNIFRRGTDISFISNFKFLLSKTYQLWQEKSKFHFKVKKKCYNSLK
jgi:hypothetical protein